MFVWIGVGWSRGLSLVRLISVVLLCLVRVARSSSGQGWGPLEPQTRVRISPGLPCSRGGSPPPLMGLCLFGVFLGVVSVF